MSDATQLQLAATEVPANSRRSCCVFFTLNRSLYPSTSSTTSVRALSTILERLEIQALWSQNYATEIPHVCSKQSR